MPSKEIIFTENAPEPGPYSQAVRYGDLLFLSGQVAEDPRTGEVVKGSIAEQTRLTLENIKAVLEAAGSSLEMVLRVNIYLTDITTKPEMNAVYQEYFPRNQPTRVAVAVKELDDDLDVEMDVIAGFA